MVRLWHDDVRPPPAGWTHAWDNDEAIRILEENDVEEASLDHDLGASAVKVDEDGRFDPDDPALYQAGRHEDDGTKLAEWLAEHPEFCPPRVNVHSWNPAGARRMADIISAGCPSATVTTRPYELPR